jgi:Ca-activated chloride channel family protein
MKFVLLETFSGMKVSPKQKLYKILPWSEVLVVAVMFVGLARPQIGRSYEEVTTKGIDIMLVLDISSSMSTLDFPPSCSPDKINRILYAKVGKRPKDRLSLAKSAARDFIKARTNDRIGLVVFSKQSFTQCPLTLDYNMLLQLLDKVNIGLIEDGTAVGMGVATALNRLKESTGKSKIIVLLTDGRNNAGKIDPATAADLASTLGVKIYAVGTGNKGISVYPQQTGFGTRYAQVPGQDINEQELQRIADATNGLYFLAETPGALKNIYATIDKLEKVEIKSRRYTLYKEIFKYFVMVGLAILAIQAILSFTLVSKVP